MFNETLLRICTLPNEVYCFCFALLGKREKKTLKNITIKSWNEETVSTWYSLKTIEKHTATRKGVEGMTTHQSLRGKKITK